MGSVSNSAGTDDVDVYSRAYVSVSISNSDEPQNNRSFISWSSTVGDNDGSRGGWASGSSSGRHTVSSAGAGRLDKYGNYDFGSGVVSNPTFPSSASGSFYVDHNATTGAAGPINASASFSGDNDPVGSASTTTANLGLTTFTGPSRPTAPTLTRSSPGTINITAQVPSSSGSFGVQLYQYRVFDNTANAWWNGSNYYNMNATGTYPNRTPSRTASITVTPTSQYTIYTRAANNYNVTWGYSAESSTTIAGIPSKVTAPTVSASNTNSQSITITWSAPSNNGAAITSYIVYRCDSDGNNPVSIGSPSPATSLSFVDVNGSIGTEYTYRVEAVNAIGTGERSDASVIIKVPGTPSAPVFDLSPISKNGRNVTVTVPDNSVDYGKSITGYYIQYQTSNSEFGVYSSWSSPILMTLDSGKYVNTYNLLTPALWYKFRVYAANSIINSKTGTRFAYPHQDLSYTSGVNFSLSTDPLFISAGGRRWNGTEWRPTEIAKRWNGTQWVDITIAKRWNGSSWVDLT